jgi:hypothetical protein
MGAAGASLLLLCACGTDTAFPDQQPGAQVPQKLRDAYKQAVRARFALVACRGPEQLQAIGSLDSGRHDAEQALAGRFAGLDLAAVKQEAEQQILTAPVEPCAASAAIERYRAAVESLRRLGGELN